MLPLNGVDDCRSCRTPEAQAVCESVTLMQHSTVKRQLSFSEAVAVLQMAEDETDLD